MRFINHILIAFLHRTTCLRVVFLFLIRDLRLILSSRSRELFAVIFLLRLCLRDQQVRIRLSRLLRLYLIFAFL